MPIYLANLNGKESLIKASTVAGARNHVLKPLAPEIKMLDGEGVADAMGRGLTIETAGETIAADPAPSSDNPDEDPK